MSRKTPPGLADRLRRILFVCMAAALSLTTFAMLTAESLEQRARLGDEARIVAELVGENSTAAIRFGDPHGAARLLESLRHLNDVSSLDVILPDGSVFASFPERSETEAALLARLLADGGLGRAHWEATRVRSAHEIRADGELLGHVVVELDFSDRIWEMLLRVLLAATIAVLAAMAALALLRPWLQSILGPLQSLAETVRAIGASRSYGMRAPKGRGDEVGEVIDGGERHARRNRGS